MSIAKPAVNGTQRYEMMRPEAVRAAMAVANVAYVPIGPIEYHGPHLPLGVDMLTAEGLVRRTATRTGGVVVPPLFIASGVLPLQMGISFGLDTLRHTVRSLLEHLRVTGFRLVVLFSGHGALDHLHVLREECDAIMLQNNGFGAMTTMWNELTVDFEGDIHDHGAKVETSYMMELWPDTVDLDRLTDDRDAEFVGVYGDNPRFTASRSLGAVLSDHVVSRLCERVDAALLGGVIDNWEDFRRLVVRLQAGPLVVVPGSSKIDARGTLQFEMENHESQSKYITGMSELRLNDRPISAGRVRLYNPHVGEGHTDAKVVDLGPTAGFYVRREQRMVVRVSEAMVDPGRHRLRVVFDIAGVMEMVVDEIIDVSKTV